MDVSGYNLLLIQGIYLLKSKSVTDIEQVLREKKSFTLRCMLDCIKELQGRVAIWNRCALSVSIISA
jgi:hypothetical protein